MRSLVIVALLAARAAAGPTTVAVEVADGALRELADPVRERLAQDGFAVVPLGARPAIVLTLSAHDDELVVAVTSPHFARSRAIDRRDAEGAELALELEHKAVELARLASESLPPPPRADREVPLGLIAPPRPRAEPPRRWAVGVDGGIVWRGAGAALGLVVGARFALADHLGLVAAGGITPASRSEITVRDVDALLGASLRGELGRLDLELAILGGVRDHHFALAMPVADRTGDRFDAELAVRGRLAWSPAPAIEVSLWAGASLARPRSHLLGAEVVWHADAIELGSGAGIGTRF